jgi:SNF2 family DNA or RNA helicase
MKLTYSPQDKRIYIKTNFLTERKALTDFPGVQVQGPYFFCTSQPRLAYNIISRLKNAFTKVELDAATDAICNQPFKLKEIPSTFNFYTEPEKAQLIALRYVYTIGGGGLLLEPGMGKTKVVLDFIALMGFRKSLIVCPKPLLFVWEDEVQKHRPDKSIYVIKSTDWEAELPHMKKADIVVINYNKAVSLYVELSTFGFQFMGVDEALIKDPRSLRTQQLTWLGRRIPHRMLMSGTLVNNSPLDVFAPVSFLEPSLVGGTFTRFAKQYAVYSGKDGQAVKFIVGYRKVPEVRSILETVSIIMSKAEWLKLPPKTFKDIIVPVSDEQREIYDDLAKNYIAQMQGKFVEIVNPLVALSKLIQVSNGFLYTSPEDEGLFDLQATDAPPKKKKFKRETLYFREQPKLDRLIKLLKEDIPDKRTIIWYNMSAEYELISKRLEQEGITYLGIRGGTKDCGGIVRRYNSDPSVRVLLCQAKAVNYGITVLGKDYDEDDLEAIDGITPEVFTQVFYSMNFSLETYLQQQDRIHRIGQKFECTYYRLIANTPAEYRIIEKIDEKMSIRGEILHDVIKSLGITLV